MVYQGTTETLFEVCERYKFMLRRCPNHDFDDLKQIQIFKNELRQQPKLLLGINVRGSLMLKSAEDAIPIKNETQ